MKLMSTLNIKSFPDKLYAKLQKRAKMDKRSLAQEVIYILELAVAEQPQLSIMDMQGLGKENWRRVNADQYIKQERENWD